MTMDYHNMFLCCSLFLCILQTALSIRCLSCTNVLQPRHCKTVRNCPNHDHCGIQMYRAINGDIRFDIDCVPAEICSKNSYVKRKEEVSDIQVQDDISDTQEQSTVTDILCEECCSGDICNSKGCGQPDFPTDRGPICFNCKQESNPSLCEAIQVCRKDEMCIVEQQEEFGDKFYTSRCIPKYECDHMNLPNIIGKRSLSPCASCCGTDLCNDHCGDQNNTTTSMKPTSSSPHIPTTTSMKLTSSSLTTTTSNAPVIYKDTTDKEFVVVFQEIWDNSDEQLSIFVHSLSEGSIVIEIPYNRSTIVKPLKKGYNYFHFTKELQGVDSVISGRLVYLNSTVPMSVFGQNRRHDTGDGFLCLPIDLLGSEYNLVSAKTPYKTRLMIGSLHNNTDISIKLNTTTSMYTSYNNRSFHNGDTINITLGRLQSIQMSLGDKSDLTGTHISANKPVFVTSGNQCSIDNNAVICDPLIESMIPIHSWGYNFFIPVIKTSNVNMIRVLASSTTTIKISDYLSSTEHNITEDRYFDMNITNPITIESYIPLFVTLFSSSDGSFQPIMITIPALEHYKNEYHIATPLNNRNSNYINIITESQYISSLRINSATFSSGFSNKDNLHLNNKLYSVLTVPISPGASVISSVNPGVNFGVLVFGLGGSGTGKSYGYPGGLRLAEKTLR